MAFVATDLRQTDKTADPGGSSVTDVSQFVICNIGNEELAVDVLAVQEINRLVEVTRVPKTPAFVEGVINLRGRIIPVLDLRRRFGLSAIQRTTHTRVVVVCLQSRLVGLVVDSVVEVLNIPKHAMEPPPSIGSTPAAEFTSGVGRLDNRLLILLDLNRLLVQRQAA